MAEENISASIIPDSEMVHDAGFAGCKAGIAYFFGRVEGCIRRDCLFALRTERADPRGARVCEGARSAVKDGEGWSSSFNPAFGDAGGATGGGNQGDDREGNGAAADGVVDRFGMREEAVAGRKDTLSGVFCKPDIEGPGVDERGGLEVRSVSIEPGG